MQIHILDDSLIIEKVKNGDKYISLDIQVGEEDFVLIHNTFYEYCSYFGTNGECIVRKCDVVDSVSKAHINLLKVLITAYNEMADINDTLTAFCNLKKEDLYKSLSEILACVKRHGKINEEEALFLFDVLSGNKSKKQMLDEQVCTYEELQSAYGKFMSEMQWCYGYKKPYIEHRAKGFFNGNVEFVYTPASFILEYKIPKAVPENIFKNILQSEKLLELNEKKIFSMLFEKFCSNTLFNQTEKVQFLEICQKAIARFESEMVLFYAGIAQNLISDNKTHIKDIAAYAIKNGYCKNMISYAMRKLGVKPDHHIRRRNEILKKFLEDDEKTTKN